MRTVCAICELKKSTVKNGEAVSHGYCKEHYKEEMRKIEDIKKKSQSVNPGLSGKPLPNIG